MNLHLLTQEELEDLDIKIYQEKRRRFGLQVEKGLYPMPNDKELELIKNGNRLEAARLFKDRTGIGFRACIAVAEYHEKQNKTA